MDNVFSWVWLRARPNNIGSDGQTRPNNTFWLKNRKDNPPWHLYDTTMQTLYVYSMIHNAMSLYLQYTHDVFLKAFKLDYNL
jgi:hypothetical protein